MLWVRIPLGVLLDIPVIVPTVARDFLLWGFLLESKPGSWCGWRLSWRLGPLSGAGGHRVRWHRVVRDPLPWSLASGLLLMSAWFAVKVADVGMVYGQGRRSQRGSLLLGRIIGDPCRQRRPCDWRVLSSFSRSCCRRETTSYNPSCEEPPRPQRALQTAY